MVFFIIVYLVFTCLPEAYLKEKIIATRLLILYMTQLLLWLLGIDCGHINANFFLIKNIEDLAKLWEKCKRKCKLTNRI